MELPHPQIVRVFEDPIIAFNGTCSDGTDGGLSLFPPPKKKFSGNFSNNEKN
jgi:hypothetical protein